MARRFRFQLETLLRVRQLREREARRKLAARRAEIARLDRLIRQTADEIALQQSALLREQEQPQPDPLLLTRGRGWIGHLRHTVAQRQALRAALVTDMTQLQAAWREARMQMRVIEKLRERRWEEHQHARFLRDQSAADELAQHLHVYEPRLVTDQ